MTSLSMIGDTLSSLEPQHASMLPENSIDLDGNQDMAKPAAKIAPFPHSEPVSQNSRDIVKGHFSNELVFGVVGFAGSGSSTIAVQMKALLESEQLRGGSFVVCVIKTRSLLRTWAENNRIEFDNNIDEESIDSVVALQNLGNRLREHHEDAAAAARLLIEEIRKERAAATNTNYPTPHPVMPDGTRRAYILDSIKHPAEVELLRKVYGNSFALIGVVCDEEIKQKRLHSKFTGSGIKQIDAFMKDDFKSIHPFGQRVGKTFYLADFYVDNSVERTAEHPDKNWEVSEVLSRLIKIVTHTEIVRPDAHETAMYFADCARLSSACLSRQVGAALVDANGSLVATGTNETPRAGGGVYGESFLPEKDDYRCAFHPKPGRKHCHNNEQQQQIIDEVLKKFIDSFPGLQDKREEIKDILQSSRIGGLVEFSRAIHAEMDALLSAARQGVSPKGARLFVTTFPCHYCARHIVTAGVDEVQFIEPYPKSKALELHDDAITTRRLEWTPPSAGGNQVLFTPFTGVAPQLYRRAFMKDRDLKDDATGTKRIGEPDWGSPWETTKLSYPELELAIMPIQEP
ncbi:MAG: cytidine deaminase [Magnetococcales bacterium]|nr:cytidine deaminase [Magnetococcales bacterium]